MNIPNTVIEIDEQLSIDELKSKGFEVQISHWRSAEQDGDYFPEDYFSNDYWDQPFELGGMTQISISKDNGEEEIEVEYRFDTDSPYSHDKGIQICLWQILNRLQQIVHIDEAAAQRFIEDSKYGEWGLGSVDLSEATGIDDDAARLLSKYEGDLILNGLEHLSDTAACALGEHDGDTLSLIH